MIISKKAVGQHKFGINLNKKMVKAAMNKIKSADCKINVKYSQLKKCVHRASVC